MVHAKLREPRRSAVGLEDGPLEAVFQVHSLRDAVIENDEDGKRPADLGVNDDGHAILGKPGHFGELIRAGRSRQGAFLPGPGTSCPAARSGGPRPTREANAGCEAATYPAGPALRP